VDLIVVADHGMVAFKGDPINLSDFADLANVHTEGSLIYAKDEAEAAKIYEQTSRRILTRASASIAALICRRSCTTIRIRARAIPVVVPNGPYNIRAKAPAKEGTLRGGHGFDPVTMPEMKAIFFAEGPDIKPETKLASFENVNVYPFITKILELRAPISDGSARVLSEASSASLSAMPIVRKASIEKAPKQGKIRLEKPSDDVPEKIALGVTPPVLLTSVAAQYTDEARKARIEGTVKLRIRIEKDGRISKIDVLEGLDKGLDQSAIQAVSQSTFKPALKDNQPVVVEINFQSDFHLF
jgi:TonB family protein